MCRAMQSVALTSTERGRETRPHTGQAQISWRDVRWLERLGEDANAIFSYNLARYARAEMDVFNTLQQAGQRARDCTRDEPFPRNVHV